MKKLLSRVALVFPVIVIPLESRMLRRILGAILVGISLLAIPTPVSANHVPAFIPDQGDPELNTPIKKIPRPIIGALREPLRFLPQIENFVVVGHDVIPNPNDTRPRGRNGPTAIAGDCMYVGNRLGRRTGTGAHFGNTALPPEVAIIDISNPKHPRTVGWLTTVRGATSREMRTIPDRNTLIINNQSDDIAATPGSMINSYQIYDISNCRNPILKQTIDTGDQEGHEFFVWRDPADAGRFLLFASFAPEPGVRVFEVLDPPNGPASSNVPVATFTLSPAVPEMEPIDPRRWRDDFARFTNKPTTQGNSTHSMWVSQDGTRTYVGNRQAGYYVLDSTNVTSRVPCIRDTVTVDETTNTNPNLCLRKLNPDPRLGNIRLAPPYIGNQGHSIYKIPGRRFAISSGERNGTNTCPWAWGQILDMWDETNPQITGRFMVPENLPENCFVGGPGDPALFREFSTHQALLFKNIFFLTWYSAGTRAWDYSNPSLPMEVGVFVPRPETNVVEYFRDSRDVWMWPHPILHNGLLYLVDENSGLYVVRYRGPRADELPHEGTFVSSASYAQGGPN